MIVFFTEANPSTGAGHVQRCLSIADALKAMGEVSAFLLCDGDLAGEIKGRGHEFVGLDASLENPDILEVLGMVARLSPEAVVVDSYHVTEKFLFGLKERVRLVYIDDRLAFPYPCDVLVNYNIYASSEAYGQLYRDSGLSVPALALGLSFAPLRREFAGIEGRKVRERAGHVLVSTGGADPLHLSEALARSLPAESALTWHFVLGSLHPDKAGLRELAADDRRIVIHENVRRMGELMRSCDLAVSAAGSTLYELCATGTPTVTFVLADNQIRGARAFSENGLMVNAGDARETGVESFARTLVEEAIELSVDFHRRRSMSEKMSALVDGMGARRLGEVILGRCAYCG